MNRQKIAQELVAVARELTGTDGFADSFNDADRSLRAFFREVHTSKSLPDGVQRKADKHIRDAMQDLDKALNALGDFL